MNGNDKTLGSVFGIFNKLSMQQKLLIGGAGVIMLVLLGFVFTAMNEPNYSPLYTNLSSEDASKVIEHLNSQKVPYKIDNSQNITIPEDKIYEMRIALAGKGVPSSGMIGYEIFDQATMGMSEFMQKLNFKRALEGEIAKTIMQLKGVEKARVNIVFPEKSIFKDEQRDPTASVALKLRGGRLAEENITAITHLVSSSVEGLRPEKVTVIDGQGRLLTKEFEENTITARSGRQYEIKSEVENYLASKAQAILDKVVGIGNSDVKVNVDLDFTQVEKTITAVDPENTVAVSEQTVKTDQTGKTPADSNVASTQNTVTNYELSKTIERVISGTGNIKRITVAAVVDGITKTTGSGENVKRDSQPRSQEQIQQLEQIVRQAVGLDNQRNDQISIMSIPFETEEVIEEEKSALPFGNTNDLINLILIAVGVIGAFFIIKNLMSKIRNEKILIGAVGFNEEAFSDLALSSGESHGALSSGKTNAMKQQIQKKKREMLQVGDIEDEISDEAVKKKLEQEKIVNYVQKNPQEAAKLINSWLREDEY